METDIRRTRRIILMQILYNIDLLACSPKEAIDNMFEDVDSQLEADFFEIYRRLQEIDEVINAVIENYNIRRLEAVARAIVRLATWEILNGLHMSVAINEALEIAKQYADDGSGQSVRFINKLLQNVGDQVIKNNE